MPKYPKLDLPVLNSEWELRLQIPDDLEQLHRQSELGSYLFRTAHTAIRLLTDASIDSPGLIDAVNIGAQIYEALGIYVDPSSSYMGTTEQTVVLLGAQEFVNSIRSTDEYLDRFNYAVERMESDTPRLAELVNVTAERYTRGDKVAQRFASQAAAVMRGMQIHVDRQIEELTAA